MGVWTNGDKISFYHRKDPNYFEDIPNIPNAAQKLKDILTERWTFTDLVAKDKLLKQNKTLSALIVEMEDEVLANAGVDVFEEVFKLIYTKLYDEKIAANNAGQILEFRNYGETDAELKETIQKIFDKAKTKWAGVFTDDDKIKLTPSHLSICVSSLQDVKLFNSNLEVIDEAFEYLMSKSQKGEKGQYFTPRYVIDMCVKMLNPNENETMIDTAAGSCGFPVHTIFHVWKKFGDSELFTAENKPPQFAEYVQNNIFAIDFDEKAVRVARTLNLIAGDGKTNVLWLNTLDYERWDERLKDEDWQDIYMEGWIKLRKLRAERNSNCDFKFDVVMANPPFAGDIKESRILHKYKVARKPNGTYQTKMGRDILFIERNLQFLKPGGRMAIVLPQGRFNNSSDKYIRDFIAERCRILAVVGLHGNVFKPHTGTKTSVLFVQKWDDTLCPRRDDYKIFFATMQKPSKDNSGEKIYVAAADGSPLRDNHNHLIVDHDLFNHEGLTADGIAEAFQLFAMQEKLSFFDSSSFDEQHYKNLLEELECTEIFLSELYADNDEHRIDSEFILKNYLQLEKILTANKFYRIKDFAAVTDGIHESIIFDDDSNINLISAKAPKENRFDLSATGFISKIQHKENPRTALKENDVIISTVGTIGNCAVVNEKILPANSDRHVGIVRIQKDFYPRYLSTFILSKFGRYQTKRSTTGNVQPNLFIYKIKEIKVPYISKDFQLQIENFVLQAEEMIKSADEVYKSAEKILAQALHLEDFKPSTKNTAVVSFSSFLNSGRLDAEYFMPKYDDLQKFLEKLPTAKLADVVTIFKSIEPGSDFYSSEGVSFIRVSDVNKFGIAEPDIKLSLKVDKNLYPCKDTILFSKDGSVGIAYKVRENLTAVTSGALLHLKLKTAEILPDYLTLYLNSKPVQMLAERYTNGAIIQHWRISDIEKIPVPIIDAETQGKIAALVEKSFNLRAESERLLEVAKSAVEIAIESGEDVAIKFLNRGEKIGN
ncbi:MAG: N-6 DNA methylase [Selenomonadaceae bacterium]|nr:N-6 DNA methylase [Selenomonadaceae bacterium]